MHSVTPFLLHLCLFDLFAALLNLVETSLNVAYVYLAHMSGWPGAPLVGFASATMTLSKTALYWMQQYFCDGCAVGHNSLGTLVLLWVVPNGYVFGSPFSLVGISSVC